MRVCRNPICRGLICVQEWGECDRFDLWDRRYILLYAKVDGKGIIVLYPTYCGG